MCSKFVESVNDLFAKWVPKSTYTLKKIQKTKQTVEVEW
jgi:hypothetical protein